MKGTFGALAASVAFFVFALALSLPADPPAAPTPSKPITKTKTDTKPKTLEDDIGIPAPVANYDDKELNSLRLAVDHEWTKRFPGTNDRLGLTKRAGDLTETELSNCLKLCGEDYAVLQAEQAKRTAAKPVAAQASTQVVAARPASCKCGPSCACNLAGSEPLAIFDGGEVAADQSFMDIETPVYEDRLVANCGPWGVPRPGLLGYSTQKVQVGTQVSRVPCAMVSTVSRTSSTRVASAPSVTSSTVFVRASPQVSTRPSNSYSAPTSGPYYSCSGGVCSWRY